MIQKLTCFFFTEAVNLQLLTHIDLPEVSLKLISSLRKKEKKDLKQFG
jgi:hypothetical protein